MGERMRFTHHQSAPTAVPAEQGVRSAAGDGVGQPSGADARWSISCSTGKCASEVAENRPGDLNREESVLQVRVEGHCCRRVKRPTVGDGAPRRERSRRRYSGTGRRRRLC